MYIAEIKGVTIKINAESGIFSPSKPDKGTLAMLNNIEISANDRMLDLGCGAGLVGIYGAKISSEKNVVMCDIDPEAVRISRENSHLNGLNEVKIYLSDGFSGFNEKDFSLILCNPPYHEDFSVAKRFIEKGFNRLAVGGKMIMVTKRREWYKNKLISIFGGVRITESDGYFVFTAEKRSLNFASGKNKK